MLYKNKQCAWKNAPELQDGDVIHGGNWARQVLTNCDKNLTLISDADFPLNMLNWNFTGEITKKGNFGNAKKDLCYWRHKNIRLENFPTYSGEGATCGPDVSLCRHVDPSKVISITSDGGDITSLDEAREDIIL